MSIATAAERCKALLEKNVGSRDADFLRSIAHQLSYRSLSVKQKEHLARLERRYSDEVFAQQKEKDDIFRASLTPEQKKLWQVVAAYYWHGAGKDSLTRTPIFSTYVGKWAKDKEYLPSEKEYQKVVEGKYGRRIVSIYNAPFKFSVGEIVLGPGYSTWNKWLHRVIETGQSTQRRAVAGSSCFSDSSIYDWDDFRLKLLRNVTSAQPKFDNPLVVIAHLPNTIISAASGAKLVVVYCFQRSMAFLIEERFLKNGKSFCRAPKLSG